ncbi:hypothetical protein TanjilG_05067 [Lupinus angustifolius]|uniref:PHL domain-containing protein n=1 Tax=Lupinus angustifolius TaxID=3871 RepID=A0A4P1R584_LUPAN|nr:hypothetical protein TanjilG_05067 [Lupinus angustifolius]
MMMIMSEKPFDGTVAMHYGVIDDDDLVDVEDHLPTLPNTISFTHAADLLAEQFCSPMAREGYVKEDDQVQVKQNRVSLPSGNQSSLPANNSLANQRMLPPGNPQVFQMSQGLLAGVSMASRPQQLDSQQAVHQQQQLQ